MDAKDDTRSNTPELSQPNPTETAPGDSIRKIAVLFTDVVGSTRYFKDLGDVAGREMLQRHQDIASSPIVEHGGVVVKTLGDSVMSYFTIPGEAVKAAIKIQQRFLHHNQQQHSEHTILVRIGIHWGEGIVEDQDIFGNVVNLAAKIVPLAGQDQIFVSNDIFKAVNTLEPVRYEKVSIPRDKKELEGMNIYQILWDESIHFDPTANILLFLRPLFGIAEPAFNTAWTRMTGKDNAPWEEKNAHIHPHDKDSLILVSDDITAAIESAEKILSILKEQGSSDGPESFLPIQILIDSGPYLRADNIVLDTQDIRWNELNPGNIYISSSAFRLVKNKKRLLTDPPFDYEHPRPIHKLISDDGSAGDPLFMYRTALLNGRHPPCFYCGSKKHPVTHCPSKNLLNLTSALDKIGYLSTTAVNGNFMDFLTVSGPTPKSGSSHDHTMDESLQLAGQGFYELKAIVQLRFFRNIWDTYSNSWDEVKTDMDSGQKGGQIWLALDMIRTARLVKAESLLNALMLEQSQDYRVLCTQGFLFLEQNNLSKAEYNFERALMFTKTKPQRIFILFLLSRLYETRGNLPRAEEKIDEILRIFPSCADARYQRLVYRLHRGQHKNALAELTKLIHEKREFFVKALIDPDLAPFFKIIDGRLKKLLDEAKEKAGHLFPKAASEKKRLALILGGDEDMDEEITASWKIMQQLTLTESYFSFLDIINASNRVLYRCLSDITAWKKKIGKTFSGIEARLKQATFYVQQYPFPIITTGIRKHLKSLHGELKDIDDIVVKEEVSQFKEAHKRALALSDQMQKIPVWLSRLETTRRGVNFLSSFFKVSLTLQTINLLVGIIFLPVVSHYLVVVFPDLKALNQNLWLYQKGYLIVGAIGGLLAAIIKPLRKLRPKTQKSGSG